MLITTLIVSFCNHQSTTLKKNSPHTKEHYDHHAQRITIINIDINTLPATTKRQRTPHRTHTTKNHNFTLTLPPPSLQNETTNVVINITVFTRVIHALFLTSILYLNLGCVIYARKWFYVNKSRYTGNFFLNIVLKAWITRVNTV